MNYRTKSKKDQTDPKNLKETPPKKQKPQRNTSKKNSKKHPKKNTTPPHKDSTSTSPEVLTARFQQIREAYDILGDEGQRAIYDTAGAGDAVGLVRSASK